MDWDPVSTSWVLQPITDSHSSHHDVAQLVFSLCILHPGTKEKHYLNIEKNRHASLETKRNDHDVFTVQLVDTDSLQVLRQ